MKLARYGVEIVLVGLVMGVKHRRRDNARRGLRKEHFRERRLDRVGVALETRELDFDGFLVGVFDVGDRFRTAEYLPGLRKTRHELLGKQRQLNPLLAEGPLG